MAFNWGSLKISHHLPRSAASLGSPTFQMLPSLNEAGGASLYTEGTGAAGFAYFGPTEHALLKSAMPAKRIQHPLFFIAITIHRRNDYSPLRACGRAGLAVCA